MSELKIFESEEFGQVRTVTINNAPYFCMADICKSLDLNNVSQAKERLNQDGVCTNEVIDSLGRKQQANFINESNMYKLIFQSRKESAERFTDWVTSEVLPSIRQTGTYQKPTSAIGQLQLQQQAILEVNEKVDEVKQDLENFKQSVPLYACDMDKITTAVKKKGVKCLGGKESNSYSDKSLRGKVYSDIYDQLKRQFGVSSYKSIRREQCEIALGIINGYQLPIILKEEVTDCNMQMHI